MAHQAPVTSGTPKVECEGFLLEACTALEIDSAATLMPQEKKALKMAVRQRALTAGVGGAKVDYPAYFISDSDKPKAIFRIMDMGNPPMYEFEVNVLVDSGFSEAALSLPAWKIIQMNLKPILKPDGTIKYINSRGSSNVERKKMMFEQTRMVATFNRNGTIETRQVEVNPACFADEYRDSMEASTRTPSAKKQKLSHHSGKVVSSHALSASASASAPHPPMSSSSCATSCSLATSPSDGSSSSSSFMTIHLSPISRRPVENDDERVTIGMTILSGLGARLDCKEGTLYIEREVIVDE